MSDFDNLLGGTIKPTGDELIEVRYVRDGRIEQGSIKSGALGGADPIDHVETLYTLSLTDNYIRFTSDDPITVVVPFNSQVPFPVGKVLRIEQAGGGQVTVTAETGIGLNSSGALYATAAQYSVIRLTKVGTDVWTLSGNRG